MSGFIAMSRSALDHPVLQDAERFRAWFWLVANAAWKPTRARIKGAVVTLERGELSFSVRFMADSWGWSKSRVDRFLAELRSEGMIETRSKIGTDGGTVSGQGQSIITICNYEKYQTPDKGDGTDSGTADGTTAGQQRDKEEQRNKGTKEKDISAVAPDYVFPGEVVRLKAADFERWQRSYSKLDLMAELQARDDWLQTRPEAERKNWFHSTSAWLCKRNKEIEDQPKVPL